MSWLLLHDGQVQRRVAEIADGIDVGPRFDQQPASVVVASVQQNVERSIAADIRRVDRDPRLAVLLREEGERAGLKHLFERFPGFRFLAHAVLRR